MLRTICCLLATTCVFADSMLQQAEEISQKYALDLAALPPPSLFPQPDRCLPYASAWIAIDLKTIAIPQGKTALQVVGEEAYLESLRLLGIQSIQLLGLKKEGIQLDIDPQMGSRADWDALSALACKKGITLISPSLGHTTGLGIDFELALQNASDYPSLYHLVEVDKSDWNLLPQVPSGTISANIPWLSLQDLYKKGYVPEQFESFTKETSWNATEKVAGVDGQVRRWIYLKEQKNLPVVSWLGSSFTAMRLSAADILQSVFDLKMPIIPIDAETPDDARTTLALWTRKLGGFSIQETAGGIPALENIPTDFLSDTLTRPALLHALIAEDAEVLRLTYRLFLERGIELKRLVHKLQPFDRFACDWSLWMSNPGQKYRYYDEQLTAEALRRLLLKEDYLRLGEAQKDTLPLSTWAGYCIQALNLDDFETQQDKITQAHSLLAFFYAMQPGIFSISLQDLLGVIPTAKGPFNLLGPSDGTLYPSLKLQLKDNRSFGARLSQMLSVRKDRGLESAELIAVPQTPHRGVLILLMRQKGTQFLEMLAVNFSRSPIQETLELKEIRQTTAIDLITSKADPKPLDSANYLLELPPLSGKLVLFQPKYYN